MDIVVLQEISIFSLLLDEENPEKMTKLMHQMGYVERLPVGLQSFSDEDQVQKWIEEKGMTACTFLSNEVSKINIDVLSGASLKFEDFDSRKVLIDLSDDLRAPVVSLDDLLDMKREAGRDQDIVDRNCYNTRCNEPSF